MPESGSVVPGDPFGTVRRLVSDNYYLTPSEVNRVHAKDDVDAGPVAHHHTIGIKHDQASAGDHKHDGVSSRLLMDGITISGSKGGNVALGNLITALAAALGFTDVTT